MAQMDGAALSLVQAAQSLLSEAPGRPDASFRYPVLATIAADGSPSARTLVLRCFQPENWTFSLHTDKRSEKMNELSYRTDSVIVFYDHHADLQVRAKGRIGIVEDPEELARVWSDLPPSNALNYLSNQPPGAPRQDAPEEELPVEEMMESPSLPHDGFRNFAILEFTATSVDILRLSRSGNLRYRLDTIEQNGEWLVP